MSLMGSEPYGHLYPDLCNDHYIEFGVITFTETLTFDRYHNVQS